MLLLKFSPLNLKKCSLLKLVICQVEHFCSLEMFSLSNKKIRFFRVFCLLSWKMPNHKFSPFLVEKLFNQQIFPLLIHKILFKIFPFPTEDIGTEYVNNGTSVCSLFTFQITLFPKRQIVYISSYTF